MNQQREQLDSTNTTLTSERAADSSRPDYVQRARDILEQHPHFRGHSNAIEIDIDLRFGTLILTGQLPSFYLKQQLQEVFRCIPEIKRIENHVLVVAADGISSTVDRT